MYNSLYYTSDLSALLRLTLVEYCNRYPDSYDVGRFKAMVTDSRNLLINDCRRCPRDTAHGTWQKRQNAISRSCVGILTIMPLADMHFIRCDSELFYARKLRDALSAYFKVTGDSGLSHWCLDKPYSSMYPLPWNRHRTQTLKFEMRQ